MARNFKGLAVARYGGVVETDAAATIPLTIQGIASQTARYLTVLNSAGTALWGLSANGNPITRIYTTKPTTGLTKGELYTLFHGSRPYLAVCTSTATSVARMIRLRTKTNGRLTA